MLVIITQIMNDTKYYHYIITFITYTIKSNILDKYTFNFTYSEVDTHSTP